MNKHYMNLGQYNNRHVTKYVNLKTIDNLTKVSAKCRDVTELEHEWCKK